MFCWWGSSESLTTVQWFLQSCSDCLPVYEGLSCWKLSWSLQIVSWHMCRGAPDSTELCEVQSRFHPVLIFFCSRKPVAVTPFHKLNTLLVCVLGHFYRSVPWPAGSILLPWAVFFCANSSCSSEVELYSTCFVFLCVFWQSQKSIIFK